MSIDNDTIKLTGSVGYYEFYVLAFVEVVKKPEKIASRRSKGRKRQVRTTCVNTPLQIIMFLLQR